MFAFWRERRGSANLRRAQHPPPADIGGAGATAGDGKTLALGAAGAEGRVYLYETATWRRVASLGFTLPCVSLHYLDRPPALMAHVVMACSAAGPPRLLQVRIPKGGGARGGGGRKGPGERASP